jgi:MFS transporter, BCD family, chlorophyll transporter
MGLLRNMRLGLLHVAVAMTAVPINGVLNRVMIEDLGILATIVAALTVVPYVLSPMQVWVGHYSDRYPLWGYRRTPYIALGLLLCIGGATLTPHAGLLMAQSFGAGLLLGVLAFGMWGVGFNLSSVGYLSLASDLSDEQHSSRTIAVMWFMMICSVIITGITVSRALEPYSDAALVAVFNGVGLAALALSALGLIGLEPRHQYRPAEARHSQRDAVRAVFANPQARLFFVYLVLLLAALLGQDVLLEPFGARAFGMSVSETAMLTPAWGGATLVALLLDGALFSRYLSKPRRAVIGALLAMAGLLLIAFSGLFGLRPLFLPGVVALGFGTGIATTTNLSLMLDMTTPAQAGLFIGAWGTANSLARGGGNLLGGVGRDVLAQLTGSVNTAYVGVFLLEALMLVGSLVLLRQLDISAFREQPQSFGELVALTNEASS